MRFFHFTPYLKTTKWLPSIFTVVRILKRFYAISAFKAASEGSGNGWFIIVFIEYVWKVSLFARQFKSWSSVAIRVPYNPILELSLDSLRLKNFSRGQSVVGTGSVEVWSGFGREYSELLSNGLILRIGWIF